MTALDRLIATPQLLEIDHIDVAAPPEEVWQLLRHGNLARSPLIRALFTIRALPERLKGKPAAPFSLRIDDLASTPSRPGFQILVDDPPREVAIGAIGKVWKSEIPFVHVTGPKAFAAFETPDFAKVAWAIRVAPRGEHDSRIEVEVRVETTDPASWPKFQRYFRIIGIGSRFIRHNLLASLERELGAPEAREKVRPLDGDDLLPDATVADTRGITIAATPEAIWPWLVQMGCRRAGFYAVDALDNGGERSARELHPELSSLTVGDVVRATPDGEEGFEVLRVEPARCLVLGGLHDVKARRQLRFDFARPRRYWQVTWAFVLEPLDATSTRVHVRARAAFSRDQRLHASWIRPVHHFMQASQLRHLAARVEGRLPPDDWRDIAAGAGGAAVIAAALATPFLRRARSHWGVDDETAARAHPGDELIPEPRWSWTHGIEIEAAAAEVWPWIAQIGADRAGFYSYQWLENLAGCRLRNAERTHAEWELRVGDPLHLHPRMPPLDIVRVEPRRFFVAYGAPDEAGRKAGKPWAAASWAFFVEPLGPQRCRLMSRYRSASSDDLATRFAFGASFIEPIGFTMDRRMLKTVKRLVERAPRGLGRLEEASTQAQQGSP